MKKYLILLASLLSANDLKYTLHTNHAFTLPKNSKEFIFEYQKVNKTIDIFHLRDDSISKNFGSIGDLNGISLQFLYGIKNNLTLLSKLQAQRIEYADGNLDNMFLKISFKNNLWNNFEKNSAISIDGGIKINKAKDITYSNSKYIEYLAKKFLNVKNLKISENKIGIVKNDGSTEVLNLKSKPSIKITNLKDLTPFITLTAEKEYKKAFVSLFTTLSYTKIHTNIKANIQPSDKTTEDKIKQYNLSKNLDRSEKTLSIGFNITSKTLIITEFSYEYVRIFREKSLNYINYNHIINLDFVKPINKKLFAFVGGELLYRQFNGVIPYLYNKYSQTTFDHKYGWARIGIGYYF